jgi:hypothetical protein
MWLLAIPVNFFAVLVHADRQAVAAFCPAAFEHIASAAGGHAFPEAMYTDTSAFLRLVCSFRHFYSSFKR